MAEREQLKVLAESVAGHMAHVAGCAAPKVAIEDGATALTKLAFAALDDTATFDVPTLFGYNVRVIVSPVGR